MRWGNVYEGWSMRLLICSNTSAEMTMTVVPVVWSLHSPPPQVSHLHLVLPHRVMEKMK